MLTAAQLLGSQNYYKTRRGGGRLPNKGRYGYAANAKPRPGKISPLNLMPGQKSAITGQVFMSFRVPKLEIVSKRSLFYQILHIFCQKLPKT